MNQKQRTHKKGTSQGKEKLPKRDPYKEAERLKKAGHSIIGICVLQYKPGVYSPVLITTY